jgi:hypothetical protein
MSTLTTKGTEFEIQIQDPKKHNWKTKSQEKPQEGHLEEGKIATPTKDIKTANQTKW